jgi:hypothetical protein
VVCCVFSILVLISFGDMAKILLAKSIGKGEVPPSTSGLYWTTEPSIRPSQAMPRLLKIEDGNATVVVVFNPLPHDRTEVISVVVSILN